MEKIWKLEGDHVIIYPGTVKQRDITEEREECLYCMKAPRSSCKYKYSVSHPACDRFKFKDDWIEVY